MKPRNLREKHANLSRQLDDAMHEMDAAREAYVNGLEARHRAYVEATAKYQRLAAELATLLWSGAVHGGGE